MSYSHPPSPNQLRLFGNPYPQSLLFDDLKCVQSLTASMTKENCILKLFLFLRSILSYGPLFRVSTLTAVQYFFNIHSEKQDKKNLLYLVCKNSSKYYNEIQLCQYLPCELGTYLSVLYTGKVTLCPQTLGCM